MLATFIRQVYRDETEMIPLYIQECYREGRYSGTFAAWTLFFDVSGFTPMTEALMDHREEGAEWLSSILNAVFAPIVQRIYAWGGFITTFTGDGFTVVFPVDKQPNPVSVLHCIHEMMHLAEEHKSHKTPWGKFETACKAGLSRGDVEWLIAGKTERTFFFRGEGIQRCVNAEKFAQRNQIILDEYFVTELPSELKCLEQILEGSSETTFFRLTQAPSDAIEPPFVPKPAILDVELAKSFLPDSLIEHDNPSEFRNVVGLFISFGGLEEKNELDEWAQLLLRLAMKFSVFINNIEFADKGGVVLCVFGAPTSSERNVEHALEFCVNLRLAIQELAIFEKLRFKLGLSYGIAYAGYIGGRERSHYTILGDQVNLAARLMTKAPVGEVWVTERVYRYTNENYKYDFAGDFHFKGKSKGESVYALRGRRATLAKHFWGSFVGREEALSQLLEQVLNLSEGRRTNVTIVYGDGGLGKSRLFQSYNGCLYHVMRSSENLSIHSFIYSLATLAYPMSFLLTKTVSALSCTFPEWSSGVGIWGTPSQKKSVWSGWSDSWPESLLLRPFCTFLRLKNCTMSWIPNCAMRIP